MPAARRLHLGVFEIQLRLFDRGLCALDACFGRGGVCSAAAIWEARPRLLSRTPRRPPARPGPGRPDSATARCRSRLRLPRRGPTPARPGPCQRPRPRRRIAPVRSLPSSSAARSARGRPRLPLGRLGRLDARFGGGAPGAVARSATARAASIAACACWTPARAPLRVASSTSALATGTAEAASSAAARASASSASARAEGDLVVARIELDQQIPGLTSWLSCTWTRSTVPCDPRRDRDDVPVHLRVVGGLAGRRVSTRREPAAGGDHQGDHDEDLQTLATAEEVLIRLTLLRGSEKSRHVFFGQADRRRK